MPPVSGTEGYAEQVPTLFGQYDSLSFGAVHATVRHLFPPPPSRVLDIGSGTGRDAAGFAGFGYRVLAVEPTAEFRLRAAALHPSANIEWLDDCLPDLALVRARSESFDLVMLTAVWMHLDATQRRWGMPNLAELLRSRGIMVMTLRHGPVPLGRRMFEVTSEETIELAEAGGLRLLFREEHVPSHWQPGVTWSRLAFTNPRG
jgi:SAM-dependent methyltransferase